MTKSNVMRPLARANAFVTAAIIAASALLPAILLSSTASAAQLENRYIDMSSLTSSGGDSSAGSGAVSGTNVTYTVGFDMPATGNVGAIVVEFCSNSPIVLDSGGCTAPTGFDLATSGAIANQNGISGFTEHGSLGAANRFVIENGTPQSITSNTADTVAIDGDNYPNSDVKFDITGIDNPSTLGSFYARIYVYAATGNLPTTSWVPTTTNAANGIGTRVHDGGIALTTVEQLTVTARVQEVLEFCIGTETDSATAGLTRIPADDCGNIDGTDIDLGVVDSNSVQRTSDGDIDNDGLAMVRTNALNGVVIFYKAEQETGLSNGGEGTLRQFGGDDCGTIAAVNNVCFNSAGGDVANPTQSAIATGTELFGMSLTTLDDSAGGATTALACDGNYDGNGSCGAAVASQGYAWDPTGEFDRIASSTGPVDDEMVNIEFAATASPTTPTGLYTVTANFVATSTF